MVCGQLWHNQYAIEDTKGCDGITLLGAWLIQQDRAYCNSFKDRVLVDYINKYPNIMGIALCWAVWQGNRGVVSLILINSHMGSIPIDR